MLSHVMSDHVNGFILGKPLRSFSLFKPPTLLRILPIMAIIGTWSVWLGLSGRQGLAVLVATVAVYVVILDYWSTWVRHLADGGIGRSQKPEVRRHTPQYSF